MKKLLQLSAQKAAVLLVAAMVLLFAVAAHANVLLGGMQQLAAAVGLALPQANSGLPQQAALPVDSSPDASYLIAKDLNSWSSSAQVVGVTEDADNYYVSYIFSTIALEGTAWQDATSSQTLTVPKAVLAGRDLGLFVAEQFKEKIQQESAYLARVQAIEKSKIAEAPQTASLYGALIGKSIDGNSDTLPGYTPVVSAPAVEVQPASPAATPPADSASAPQQTTPQETAQPAPASSAPDAATSTPDTSTAASTTPDAGVSTTTDQTSQPADTTNSTSTPQ